MKVKKPILKVIQIGTLFVFTSLSFLGLISFSNIEISNFRTIKKNDIKIIKQVSADDREEEDEDEDEEYEEDSRNKTRVVNPIIISSSGVTNSGTINNVKTDKIVNNLFSIGLSDLEKTNISLGIDNKLYFYTKVEKIKKLDLLSSKIEKIIQNLENLKSKSINEEYIGSLENKISIYEDVQDIINTKISKLEKSLVNDTKKAKIINKTSTYKAPNGKIYTIIEKGDLVTIKKSDGSYAKQSFKTYDEAIAYLNKNAITQPKKVVVNKTPVKKTTSLNTNITKTVTPTPVITKPAVVEQPKVDTTTKAS